MSIDLSHQVRYEAPKQTASIRTRTRRILCFFLALYAVVVFGYLTATLATFFIDRDAESGEAELASAKSIKALQAEITGLRTDIQALVQQDIDK